MSDESLTRLQQSVGYTFRDLDLLRTALTHRSRVAEQVEPAASYERLEFLGDAVLQLAVTDYLFHEHPDLAEGEMAKVRAAVVNEATLTEVAAAWGLGGALILGKGEEASGGKAKSSILSDVVESLFGAIYVETGFATVRELILEHLSDRVDERAVDPGRRDYKTRLQERLARRGIQPEYVTTDSGPEHQKEFVAQVFADGQLLGVGRGTSKKRAEQDAARNATKHSFSNDA